MVDSAFPIPKEGILGHTFLHDNKAIINIADKTILINNEYEDKNSITIKLEPRTETIIEIPIKKEGMENKNILVHKQEIMEDVYSGNIISRVKEGKAVISILNISESPREIKESNLDKIKYDDEFEYNMHKISLENNDTHRIDKIKTLIRSEHMNEEERNTILKLCEQYSEIFYLKGDKLTYTDVLEHEIKILSNQPPIYKKPYRLPHAQKLEIENQIQEMLTNDIIEPSKSPWNAPLLLVKKKMDASGINKFRIVVDFRALNEVTINEFHPLPNISDILDQLGQCKLFSVLDLASGFYQIPLSENSRELTAFSTSHGHWHFKRMIMGMRTSPATFQRLMNTVLSGIIGIKCLVYLDDIIIYGKNLIDHNNKLQEVFERLLQNNLKIQPDKCEFLKRECIFLGHVISENGIKPDKNKIRAVLEFPQPLNVKQIKSYLGLSGYYRRFINNYSTITKPLTNLLRKDVKFEWNENCQKAFDEIKSLLCSEPILKFPDFTKTFILTTDASGQGLGAILSQGEIGNDLPIAYASRTLNKSESNYSTIELECLGIIYGVKQFRP